MEKTLEERDWKYLRSIRDDMLQELCSRSNGEVADILADEARSPRERYFAVWRHLKACDRIVTECFDDWRRSRLGDRILSLRRHGVLKDSHVQNLSESAREWLCRADELMGS
jgi:hypothetical protein